ncbi:hypothetical protein [Cellulomonas carbonis]|uniref:hypothetical protein n=1 Tax=Cellulomonas carbonis TaxID=1386092 RepID=UPI000B2268FD|nr:hypothetical protein [Cellulomonas carbonis]MDT0166323.1 hypothetical protein [Actinotalea sp. AC32]GGC01920.1 hypothetical protein GCM10010972_13550 [Cellulomonas carbonis]
MNLPPVARTALTTLTVLLAGGVSLVAIGLGVTAVATVAGVVEVVARAVTG